MLTIIKLAAGIKLSYGKTGRYYRSLRSRPQESEVSRSHIEARGAESMLRNCDGKRVASKTARKAAGSRMRAHEEIPLFCTHRACRISRLSALRTCGKSVARATRKNRK